MPLRRPISKGWKLKSLGTGFAVDIGDTLSLDKHMALAINEIQEVIFFRLLGWIRQGKGGDQSRSTHDQKQTKRGGRS